MVEAVVRQLLSATKSTATLESAIVPQPAQRRCTATSHTCSRRNPHNGDALLPTKCTQDATRTKATHCCQPHMLTTQPAQRRRTIANQMYSGRNPHKGDALLPATHAHDATRTTAMHCYQPNMLMSQQKVVASCRIRKRR